MSINDLLIQMSKVEGYSSESPKEKHHKEVVLEVLGDALSGKGINNILTTGNITGRTRFLRLRSLRIVDGRNVINDKWVYTNSTDKLLVYMTEVALRYFLCFVTGVSFEDSLKRSLVDLVTKYEVAGGDYTAVCKLLNLIYDEYDMVSSPDNATEKDVMNFIHRFNDAIKAVVSDIKCPLAILLECTKNMPESVVLRQGSSKKDTGRKSA